MCNKTQYLELKNTQLQLKKKKKLKLEATITE